jgi:hypothetical protein
MRNVLSNASRLKPTAAAKLVPAVGFAAAGAAAAVAGIYVGETDDAPGAALIGIVLMIGLVTLGVKTARRR